MMYLKQGGCPEVALPPIAAVYLERHHMNQRLRATDMIGAEGEALGEVDYERACALQAGAQDRALTAGRKDSHGDQAACLLAITEELDDLLSGAYSHNCELKLDPDEMGILRTVRGAVVGLIRWHLENGAGALVPVAKELGLIAGVAA